MILLIDNYDSFVFNLCRYLRRLGQEVEVCRNDAVPVTAISRGSYAAIVISPGPRAPQQAGQCLDVVRQFCRTTPILGVCLGHQVVCEAFGGSIVRAQEPVHGRSHPIRLAQSPLFDQLAAESHLARYHSLVADPATLPDCLRVTAWSASDEVMGVEHAEFPTYGVQFHPESVLSLDGYRILANFLTIAGLSVATPLPSCDLAKARQVSTPSSSVAPSYWKIDKLDSPQGRHLVPAVLPRAIRTNGSTTK